MSKGVRGFLGLLAGAARDLTPIILVIAFFQVLVIRQPFPNLGETVAGLVFVVAGLAFFVQGLEMGLFPIGDTLAHALARKGSLALVIDNERNPLGIVTLRDMVLRTLEDADAAG